MKTGIYTQNPVDESYGENLIVRRTAFYLISKDEIDDYAEWEDAQRGITRVEDDPDTVARLVPKVKR
jgi:hypothetical protein